MAGEMLLVNPRKRKRRRKGGAKRSTRTRRNPSTRRRKRRSPARRRRSYAKRNPSRRRRSRAKPVTQDFVNSMLIPAGGGALGALGVDVVWGYLPVPDEIKTGPFSPFAKMAAAVGVGWGISQFTSKRTGRMVIAGAVTVSLYNLFKNWTQQMLPGVPLGDAETMGYTQAGQFLPDENMGAYLPGWEPQPEMTEEGSEMGEYISAMY